jgi:hypothetical protein
LLIGQNSCLTIVVNYPGSISDLQVMFAVWYRAVVGHSTSLMWMPLPKEGFYPGCEEHQHRIRGHRVMSGRFDATSAATHPCF